jgi:hypothetical protein
VDGTRFSGWLLFATLLALVPLAQGSREAPQPAATARTEEKGAGTAKGEADKKTAQPSPWEGPARLIFNLTKEDAKELTKEDAKEKGKALWLRFAAESKKGDFTRLDPLIALVPCPWDSNLAADFDQATSALQEAYADAGYLLEGWWLPWSGDPEKDRTVEQVPGLMVFRHYKNRERAVALMVGEVPARGVHRAAFRAAVEGIRRWAADMAGPTDAGKKKTPCKRKKAGQGKPAAALTIRVLGPAISDSALSLAQAIKEVEGKAGRDKFEVITGSARSKDVSAILQASDGVTFKQPVVTEDVLQKQARSFFDCEMGWDFGRPARPGRVALLTEADNAYGQPFLTLENARDSLLVRFPPGIAGVRSAWDQDQRPRDVSAGPGTVKVPEVTLDLRLGERGRLVLVPEMSNLTVASRDLAIANLLASLADRKISYIGVLASDPRDAAYLIDRIRRFAPSALLFLVDDNLAFTHPRLGPILNGTLVIGGSSLFAGDEPVSAPAGETRRRYLSQFTSDLHEGIYRAARSLIASARGDVLNIDPKKPSVWVSAVGNGSLWPLAQLGAESLQEPPNDDCRAWSLAQRRAHAAIPPQAAATTGTKLLISALALAVLTFCLYRFATPPERAGWRACWLLAAAASALGLAAGVFAILGSLPYPHHVPDFSGENWKQLATGFILLGTSLVLVVIVVLALGAGRPTPEKLALSVAVPLLTVGLLFGLAWAIRFLWLRGGESFFLRRAFTFSSGLSPLVSLAWLAGSMYLWAFVELRRERMQARQVVEWPGPNEGPTIQAFERCRSLADELRNLLDGPWPWWTGRRSWWVPLLPFLLSLPLLIVLRTIHPIAEPRIYGCIFLFLLVLTFYLGGYSFCRFLGAWLILQKILDQLALPHPPAGLDADLATLVAWSPMKSFGWAIPRFTMSSLVAGQIEKLIAKGRADADLAPEIQHELERSIVAHRDDDIEEEVDARQELRQRFDQAYRQLAGPALVDPDVQHFIALRLVSYIRYIFDHLRLCLIAAGACGFPLLVAASTYAFEPNELVTNGIWAALLVAVLLTLYVFLQMDRDVVLSLISGTTPKKVELNRQLVTNFLTYGAVPLLGLIASQFPQIGRYTVSLVNPLLRAVSGGP